MSIILVLLLGLSLAYGNTGHPDKDVSGEYRQNADTMPMRRFASPSFITVPENCPEGQHLIDGACRCVFKREISPDNYPRNADNEPVKSAACSYLAIPKYNSDAYY